MSGRTAEDLKGQKKWTTVSNRMLMHIIRTKLGWDSGKTPRRFYGVPWPEQYAILFDLTRAPPRTRTPNLSSETSRISEMRSMSWKLGDLTPFSMCRSESTAIPIFSASC